MPRVAKAVVFIADGCCIVSFPERRVAAVCDADDYEKISRHCWRILACDGKYYITSHTAGLLHRFVLGYKGSLDVDHKDSNTLNNRKTNLRVVTRQQNLWNSGKHRDGCSSMFKGVYKVPNEKCKTRSWEARIRQNGKNVWLGYYATEVEAAQAYNKAAQSSFGTYARLNAV
jgi:hypothetical protein